MEQFFLDLWKDVQFDADWMVLMWVVCILFVGVIWLIKKAFTGLLWIGSYIIGGVQLICSCVATAFRWIWRKACE